MISPEAVLAHIRFCEDSKSEFCGVAIRLILTGKETNGRDSDSDSNQRHRKVLVKTLFLHMGITCKVSSMRNMMLVTVCVFRIQ